MKNGLVLLLVVFSTTGHTDESHNRSESVEKIHESLNKFKTNDKSPKNTLENEVMDLVVLLHNYPNDADLLKGYRPWTAKLFLPFGLAFVGGYFSGALIPIFEVFITDNYSPLKTPLYLGLNGALLGGWLGRFLDDSDRVTVLSAKQRLIGRLKHLFTLSQAQPSVRENIQPSIKLLLDADPEMKDLFEHAPLKGGYVQRGHFSTWFLLESTAWAAGCTIGFAKLLGVL